MNKGAEILNNQNLDVNIDKLLAQRRLYTNAKKINYLLIFITVFAPIVISYLTNFSRFRIDDKNWIYVLYTIIVIIFEKILELYIDRCKKTAASIQENFDTKLFGIPENETLNLTYVDLELIRKYSKRDRKDIKKVEKVTDWYSNEINMLQSNLAVLFCQRMNISYDHNIKKKYSNILVTISILTFLILLIFALSGDFSLKKFFIEVIFPSMPLFMFTFKEFKTNLETVDNLQKLREIIENKLNTVSLQQVVENEDLRNIQDRIFQNRITSPLIPNLIYNILWGKLEDQMNYSVKNKIRELT